VFDYGTNGLGIGQRDFGTAGLLKKAAPSRTFISQNNERSEVWTQQDNSGGQKKWTIRKFAEGFSSDFPSL
jgi:hypothetical protein